MMLVSLIMAFAFEAKGQDVTVSSNNDDNTEGAGIYKAELTSGSWVLTGMEQKSFNGTTLTKWNGKDNNIDGVHSWQDILDIIHTVNSGFKWQAPPQTMQPGAYLNLEAVYTNLDYSTPSNVKTGIKMFIDREGVNYGASNTDAIEILKVNKDNKSYANEVKKGFFLAPKTLFDETNKCQLIVDCFIGKDHYVTTYTYEYQP